jgi:hypothetical protein
MKMVWIIRWNEVISLKLKETSKDESGSSWIMCIRWGLLGAVTIYKQKAMEINHQNF